MIVIWGSRKSRATFEDDLRSGVVRPNLTHFFRFDTYLGPTFGFKWVRLTLRFQKWVQSGWVDLKKGSNSGLINSI